MHAVGLQAEVSRGDVSVGMSERKGGGKKKVLKSKLQKSLQRC